MAEIIKERRIVKDTWQLLRLIEGQSVHNVSLPEGRLIVPYPVWHARNNELRKREFLGVWLSDVERPELIAEDISRFQVIAIDFPKFANGRGYSSAVLLRSRYGFRGELRAIGDVLRDQLFYLERVGFDSFSLRADRSLENALDAFGDFSVTYQGSSDRAEPLFRSISRR